MILALRFHPLEDFCPSSRCRDLLPAGGEKGHAAPSRSPLAACGERARVRGNDDHGITDAKIVAAAEGGVQGVFVYDLEVPD
jgi:hypothetical protein